MDTDTIICFERHIDKEIGKEAIYNFFSFFWFSFHDYNWKLLRFVLFCLEQKVFKYICNVACLDKITVVIIMISCIVMANTLRRELTFCRLVIFVIFFLLITGYNCNCTILNFCSYIWWWFGNKCFLCSYSWSVISPISLINIAFHSIMQTSDTEGVQMVQTPTLFRSMVTTKKGTNT